MVEERVRSHRGWIIVAEGRGKTRVAGDGAIKIDLPQSCSLVPEGRASKDVVHFRHRVTGSISSAVQVLLTRLQGREQVPPIFRGGSANVSGCCHRARKSHLGQRSSRGEVVES